MVPDVFSLHKIQGEGNVNFPFSVKDYQHYVFGDIRLAHRFGTDLAKAFIARGPDLGAAQREHSNVVAPEPPVRDIAVAVLSGYIPTATHSLRNAFVACLNRYLFSIDAQPVVKIDIEKKSQASNSPGDQQITPDETYHIDEHRLGSANILVLGDIRMSREREDQIESSLCHPGRPNKLSFVYLASFDGPIDTTAISPILSRIVSPSIKDVEALVQLKEFSLNESLVQCLLGWEYGEFSQLVRRQDDGFVRLLLDYAIGGGLCALELYAENFKFLLWEVDARESM